MGNVWRLTLEQVSMAFLTLEEVGLIEYDEDENSFEPTELGLDGERWLVELRKLIPGDVFIGDNQ